jgi:cell fate (sporulation/competence/biofilm development) regulator YmcA (YheA/YmcA/DUF963 family)
LKQNAMNDMEQAMAALSNPDVMAEMTKMLQDPKFKETFEQLTKDSQFQNYIDAMKELQKDPVKRKKFDAAAETLKTKL